MEIIEVGKPKQGKMLYCKGLQDRWYDYYLYFFQGHLLPRVTMASTNLIKPYYLGIKTETYEWFWQSFDKVSNCVKKENKETIINNCLEVKEALINNVLLQPKPDN